MILQKNYSFLWILLVVLFSFATVKGTNQELGTELTNQFISNTDEIIKLEIHKFGKDKFGETKKGDEKKTNLEQLAEKVIEGSLDDKKQLVKKGCCKYYLMKKKKIQSKMQRIRHLLLRVDDYTNREFYLNNYLQKYNSKYENDPRVNLQKFPMRYIIAHPYFFDYYDPLQWLTMENITYFEQDFRQLLQYTQQSPAFTTMEIYQDWFYYMMFLPKIKFYHALFQQIESEFSVVPRQYQILCKILSNYVDIVIKCCYNNISKKYLFAVVGQKICRIFTWPKNSCSYSLPELSVYKEYIKIRDFSNHFIGSNYCRIHAKIPIDDLTHNMVLYLSIIFSIFAYWDGMAYGIGYTYYWGEDFNQNKIGLAILCIGSIIFFSVFVSFILQIFKFYYLNYLIWPFRK